MSTGRVPTTANSPLTTKGDLFTYDTSQARLAVGSNGETLVADSSTSTGLRYQSGYNGNAIINGGMDIWQRGTSIAYGVNALVYAADRWVTIRVENPSNATASRQASSLTGIQYCSRIARTAGDTSTVAIFYATSLESADSYRFAGQTATLSFYARAGANYSPTSGYLVADLVSGTGTDQNVMSGFTGSATVATTNAVLTTSWTRYTITGAVSSSATQLAVKLTMNPTGTAGAADYFEVTGVQIELGSVATNFKRAGGTLAGELAACQRYYLRITPVTSLGRLGNGNVTSSTGAEIGFTFPVTMRTSPTALEQSGTATDYSVRSGGTNTTCSAVPAFNVAEPSQAFVNFTVASGLTTGQAAIYRNPNTAGYLGWSAEL